MNLEPDAFRGKFPAQVKFKIFKECLPLHESSLRRVIKENYEGRKFKQELSGKQVRNLLSSFRPLAASCQLAPPTLPNVALSQARPPSAMEDRYPAGVQYYHGPPVMENQPVPIVHITQHGYHGTAAYMERLPYAVQEPHSRYGTVQERGIHDQLPGLKSEYRRLPLQREVLHQNDMVTYSSYPPPAAPYASSVVQPQARAAGYSSYPCTCSPIYFISCASTSPSIWTISRECSYLFLLFILGAYSGISLILV
ncbi:Uncharacterized protein Adt_45732 [Abeliophyllum distichum]|uniref:DCD domain-containing protein n=1 Tax=Abeliophyllum distichum TaxID=126358 RepID=A0ABD1PEM3_9LAMI